MSEFTRYESDTAIGVKMSFPLERENYTATATLVLIEQSDHSVVTPYIYLENCRDENDNFIRPTNVEMESLFEQLWQLVRDSDTKLISVETKEIASEVLDVAQKYEEAIKSSGVMDAEVGYVLKEGDFPRVEEFSITAMLYNRDAPAERSNIEYYLTDSGLVDSTDNIYEIALQVANIAEYERCQQLDRENLQAYYVEHIHDIRNMNFKDMNEEQRSHMMFFSDWHKDVHGHRPHDDDRNECLRHYKWEQSRKEANIEKE